MIQRTCMLKAIPVKGGALLEIHGGFKLQCIGNNCDNYETCERGLKVDQEYQSAHKHMR